MAGSSSEDYVKPLYRTGEPNAPIVLHRGPVTVLAPQAPFSGEGELAVHFVPSPKLVCVVDGDDSFRGIDLDWEGEFELERYGVRVRGAVIGIRKRMMDQPPSRITIRPSGSGIAIGQGDDAVLRRLVFHVVNFYEFYGGARAVHRKPNGSMRRLGKLGLRGGGWRIALSCLPQTGELIGTLKVAGGYAVTHAGTINKDGGVPFSGEQAETIVLALQHLLSFARGFWCGPILLEGFNASDECLWKRWAVPVLDSWRSARSWFCPHHAASLEDIFPAFLARWRSGSWGKPLRHAIYWYLAANTGTKAADAGLILAQAALELLSWTYGVLDRSLISHEGFRRLRASDEMRMLLSSLDVPIGIPAELPELAKRAEAMNWLDGPHALTEIRNCYVHPQSDHDFGDVIAEAWQLSLWYIELVLLRLLEYRGEYSNRLKPGWVGEVEQVPWAR